MKHARLDMLIAGALLRNAGKLRLPFLLASAKQIYPERTFGAYKGRLKFLWACLIIRARLVEMLDCAEHEGLRQEIATRPETLGFALWPYLHAGWPAMQRFEALSQHRQALRKEMSVLSSGDTASLVVADLSDVLPGLTLTVDRAPWCLREGSLVFNQFFEDERMMTLAFSFGKQHGEYVVYVGSVQGAKVDGALEKYRKIGKALYGMRSRDFVIKSFQLMMYHLGVKRILCISEDFRHHRHPYFGAEKSTQLHLNYDQIWREHSAEPADDGFFRLGLFPVERAIQDIAQKNRSLYRKRYAMMSRLSTAIAKNLGKVDATQLSTEAQANE